MSEDGGMKINFELYPYMKPLFDAIKSGKKIVNYYPRKPTLGKIPKFSNDGVVNKIGILGKDADAIVFSEYNIMDKNFENPARDAG